MRGFLNTGQYPTPAINWGSRLTKGLCHVLMPAFSGGANNRTALYNMDDLVSKHTHCDTASLAPPEAQSNSYQKPNVAVRCNQFVTDYYINGPCILWEYEKDFSILVQAAGSALASGAGIWGSGASLVSDVGLLAIWLTTGSIVFYWGSGGAGDRSESITIVPSILPAESIFASGAAVLTWNGHTKVGRVYYDGAFGGPSLPWTHIPFTSILCQSNRSFQQSISAWARTYMWEAELQPQDALALSRNPDLIFGNAPRHVQFLHADPPPSPILPLDKADFTVATFPATFQQTKMIDFQPGAFSVGGQNAVFLKSGEALPPAVQPQRLYGPEEFAVERTTIEALNLLKQQGLSSLSAISTVDEMMTAVDQLLSHEEYRRVRIRLRTVFQRAEDFGFWDDADIDDADTVDELLTVLLERWGEPEPDVYSAALQGT